MKLTIPFLPDPEYAQFLSGHTSSLSSIYFPMPKGPVLDSRVRVIAPGKTSPSLSGLIKTLALLKDIKKYILVNTRFSPPSLYTDTRVLTDFLDRVETLHKAVGIQGLVISDFYLINGLDHTRHDIIGELEAVAGVNTMIDSMEKVSSVLDILGATRFKPPGRLLLDRSLNRDPQKLSSIYQRVKSLFPKINVELLANEGCIFLCPFKPAHDAHISLSNTGLVKESTWKTNHSLGCHAYFNAHPQKFLKSPFIRPEDMVHYHKKADSLKLCGRTLGSQFLKQCIQAYIDQAYGGNLLDLMDTANFLSHRFHIDNTRLGPSFYNTLTTCTKDCRPCKICKKLFEKTSYEKPVTLDPIRTFDGHG
ncbi:MAG: hypothetical protein HUN05_10495 [Desulfobacter sp.]|nr:MAG: hypothetical protein HUN05_10495 [Desulfobacter sp.]